VTDLAAASHVIAATGLLVVALVAFAVSASVAYVDQARRRARRVRAERAHWQALDKSARPEPYDWAQDPDL
jgi:hypothetical protein